MLTNYTVECKGLRQVCFNPFYLEVNDEQG